MAPKGYSKYTVDTNCSHLVTECRPARRDRRETRTSLGAFLVYCVAGLAVVTLIVAIAVFASLTSKSDAPAQTGQSILAPSAIANS